MKSTKGIAGKIRRVRRSVPWLKAYHLMIVLVLGIVAAHGLMLFSMRNQSMEMEQMGSKIASAEQELQRTRDAVIPEEQLGVHFQQAGQNLASMRRLVPNYVDNTEFIGWLLDVAERSGVDITSLQHRNSSPEQLGDRQYVIKGFQLEVSGVPSDLVAFVAALERSERHLMVVDSTQFSSSDTGAELSVALGVYTLPAPDQSATGGSEDATDGGSGKILIKVLTEEMDGAASVAYSSGYSSSNLQGTGGKGAEQMFNFSPSYSRPFDVTQAGGPSPSEPLVPGIYTVNYNTPRGWDMVESYCADGSPPGAIFLEAGEEVTCTFRYARRGFIMVEVATEPRGEPQEFAFFPTHGDYFRMTQADPAVSSEPLISGIYGMEHQVPPGWDLKGVSCDDSSITSSIELYPGEVVTCTYNYVKRGHILIEVMTDPKGDAQEFTFSPGYGDRLVLTDADARNVSELLLQGTYSINQETPNGWDLDWANCDDGSPIDAISLSPGEVISCSFSYRKRGYILVEVTTAPQLDSQEFSFRTSYGGDFSLTHGPDRHESDPLAAGLYRLDHQVPPGWQLAKASCDDGSPVDAISVDAGEIVFCTFSYSKGA